MARVAVVTGGTRGIGAAVSKALKAAGRQVAATYHSNDEAAAKFKAETGVHVYKWNVADYDECMAGLAKVAQELGPVDILVNNAGITKDGMFHKMTPDQWYGVINTNLNSLFNMMPTGDRRACASAGSAASSTSRRSTARRDRWDRPTIPRPRPATSASPRRWRRRAPQGHHRQRDLPRLYRDRNGHGHQSRRTCAKKHPSPNPGGPPRRAGGDRPLRRLPRRRRRRLHHRRDAHGQRRAVYGLSSKLGLSEEARAAPMRRSPESILIVAKTWRHA